MPHRSVQRLAGYARAGFLAVEAVALDPEQGRLTLRDGSGGEYDILSIDIGSTSPAFGIPGVPKQVIPAKPIEVRPPARRPKKNRQGTGACRSPCLCGERRRNPAKTVLPSPSGKSYR